MASNCKYCGDDYTNETLINTTAELSRKRDFYPGISVCIENDELWVISSADTYEPSYQEACVKIKFCPMCGRKLEE